MPGPADSHGLVDALIGEPDADGPETAVVPPATVRGRAQVLNADERDD